MNASTSFRGVLGLLPALALLAAPRAVLADEILIYQRFNNDVDGGDAAAGEAEEVLEGLGHDVTVVASLTPVLPADLSLFDTIWVVQLGGLIGAEQNALRGFVNAGGGLYLTGEREECCSPLNTSLDTFTAPLLVQPFPNFGGQGQEGGALFTPNPADPFGLTTTPNEITQWETLGAGVLTNAPPARVVFSNASALAGAVALAGEDLERGAGCLYVAMDLSYWLDVVAPNQDVSPLVENIQAFLNGCGDSDQDGLSDEGESGFGTAPDDPDSDDDGLCDGYGAVQGSCISGESPFDDFDNDGTKNSLDEDDDGDGLSTAFEMAAEERAPNVDGDQGPAYWDFDADGDNLLDQMEGSGDYDDDGIPAIVDLDDFPSECANDADCSSPSGLHCNTDVGYCHPDAVIVGGAGGSPSSGLGGLGSAGERAGRGGDSPSDGDAGEDGTGTSAGGSGADDMSGAGDGGDPAGRAAARDDGGCGCSLVGASNAPVSACFATALLALLAYRRRRDDRRGRCSP